MQNKLLVISSRETSGGNISKIACHSGLDPESQFLSRFPITTSYHSADKFGNDKRIHKTKS